MTAKNQLKIFCPATVANVNCGFDALGFALEGIGEEMYFTKTNKKEVVITKITGASLPYEVDKNVAGVAATAMLKALDFPFGVEIEIHKKIRSGSGIGSSSASAAGAVFGINQLLPQPLTPLELTRYAMKGEALASGNEHADNVAPCIYGGMTLISSYDPLHIVALPIWPNLYVGIIHPHISIHTKKARTLLPSSVPIKDAITQSQNLAGLVASLYEWDPLLFAQSLKDVLIEPHRSALLPYFSVLRQRSLDAGCVAFGISGSGPSMFSFAFDREIIQTQLSMVEQFYQSKEIVTDTYLSNVSPQGCSVLSS